MHTESKASYTYVVYTEALQYVYRNPSKAQVYIAEIHGA